jgi:hypothetical protein
MAFHNESFINDIKNLIEKDFIESNMFKQIYKYIQKIRQVDSFTLKQTRNYVAREKYDSQFIAWLFNRIKTNNVTFENYKKIKKIIKYYKIISFYEELREFGFNLNLLSNKYNLLNIFFYSAYPIDLSIDNFIKKNIIWFSYRLDQAILHPLDTKEISQPVFFEFKMKNVPIIILQSTDKDNKQIFTGIPGIIEKFITFINNLQGETFTIDNIFSGNNNKYILYLLEAINRIYNCKFFKINGYMNELDQCEIALMGFNNLVQSDSVIKYIYTKLKYNDCETILPLVPARNIRTIYEISGFYHQSYINNGIIDNTKSRMDCQSKNLQIYYKAENTTEEYMFNCLELSSAITFEQKYLKYKAKYLQLKKQFNLN